MSTPDTRAKLPRGILRLRWARVRQGSSRRRRPFVSRAPRPGARARWSFALRSSSYAKVCGVTEIRGRTAVEIATSVRDSGDSGVLARASGLPTVRSLAAQLGVNRNTVASAYALLVNAGVAETDVGHRPQHHHDPQTGDDG